MLTTELLIIYGFDKVLNTPLEKWSFEHLILHIEKKSGSIYFRVHDIHKPTINLCIYTEDHFLQFLRIVDNGGSLADYVSESNLLYLNDSILEHHLQDIQRCQMN